MGKKVAVLGAAGGIGQPLSLLLKLSPHVTELSCYDIVGTPGVAADLSHIPSASTVTGNMPSAGSWPPSHDTGIEAALKGASVVVIPAGVPRKPGMTRDDLFNTNAGKMSVAIYRAKEQYICCDAPDQWLLEISLYVFQLQFYFFRYCEEFGRSVRKALP